MEQIVRIRITNNKESNYNFSIIIAFFISWCGWWDLNPHERRSLPPQDSASASSATTAYIIIYCP